MKAPHIWLASNRTTFSVCAVCMAARKEPALFLSRVLYKSIMRGESVDWIPTLPLSRGKVEFIL